MTAVMMGGVDGTTTTTGPAKARTAALYIQHFVTWVVLVLVVGIAAVTAATRRCVDRVRGLLLLLLLLSIHPRTLLLLLLAVAELP